MARNSSGPSGLGRLGTWRSGGESPSFPGSGDARRLLGTVDVRPERAGCTLVRVRLGDSDRRTLVRVRERLLGAEHIVGTSIGRDCGPDDQGTFDILVVPDYDPVTVGREIAEVDDVVGVAATAFESQDREGRPTGAVDTEQTTVPRSTDDDAASDLRSTIEAGTEDVSTADAAGPTVPGHDAVDIPGVLESANGDGDSPDGSPDARPVVGGLDALEKADRDPSTRGRPSLAGGRRSEPARSDGDGSRQSTNRRGGNGRPEIAGLPASTGLGESGTIPDRHRVDDGDDQMRRSGDDGIGDRLDRLDDRLSELESAFGVGDRGAVLGRQQRAGPPTTEELADRLAALEAAVVELERRERRLRDALLGDSA